VIWNNPVWFYMFLLHFAIFCQRTPLACSLNRISIDPERSKRCWLHLTSLSHPRLCETHGQTRETRAKIRWPKSRRWRGIWDTLAETGAPHGTPLWFIIHHFPKITWHRATPNLFKPNTLNFDCKILQVILRICNQRQASRPFIT